jgi:hypothetical protein
MCGSQVGVEPAGYQIGSSGEDPQGTQWGTNTSEPPGTQWGTNTSEDAGTAQGTVYEKGNSKGTANTSNGSTTTSYNRYKLNANGTWKSAKTTKFRVSNTWKTISK